MRLLPHSSIYFNIPTHIAIVQTERADVSTHHAPSNYIGIRYDTHSIEYVAGCASKLGMATAMIQIVVIAQIMLAFGSIDFASAAKV